jgi:hypothetical protein
MPLDASVQRCAWVAKESSIILSLCPEIRLTRTPVIVPGVSVVGSCSHWLSADKNEKSKKTRQK